MTSRAARALRLHGPAGMARIAGRRAGRRLRADESHVWYGLDVNGERPRRELPDGLELRKAADPDLASVEQLPGAEPVSAMRRGLSQGHELWIVCEGDRTAFVCWVHLSTAPVLAAPRGMLELPAGVACLEDSVTSPDYRGRGVAPAAWCGIADALAASGYKSMITKVETDNVASRRAVEKAGFVEIATMRLARRWPITRVSVVAADPLLGVELANRLG
jgi:ribosomal protein S18 acetylase RimI-like enzyme